MTTLGPTPCHFVPPYLLQELGRTGALDQARVEAILRRDADLRGRRGQGRGQVVERDTDARWTVHTARNSENLPGDPLRNEGDPETGDEAADEAASGITSTLDLFRDVYERDSFDGDGARVLLTVHYGQDYANAFWDGEHLVFGDGDGKVFRRFTRAVDVLAHELSHAVTEHTAALVYQGQSGALNESVSDVFAACLKQRLQQEDAGGADWLIGEEIFVEGIKARGLRDMERPGTAYDDPALGKDPQPGHMDDFVETTDDNGGVHINSGIPNRAFVLAAKAVGGSTAEGAGRIWYRALTSGDVAPDADFAAFAAATVSASGDHADAVREAWAGVGVTAGAGSGGGGAPTPPEPGGTVVVRRSGGITGQVVEGSVDPSADDEVAREVRDLLARIDLRARAAAGTPQTDRYVYVVVGVDGQAHEVQEGALDDDTRRLVQLVLGD